jgi:hypothetical protein
LRNLCRSVWRILPALLAFCLLAAQIAIPWMVPHFVTQDGPSYVYTAVVAKKLLVHAQPYAALYRFNPQLIPNWGSLILLAASASIAGPGHAEALAMSLMLCFGFFSLSYAIRSLSPKTSPWSPISNCLLQTWFLWIGFYSFYLGMLFVPLAFGFYVRRDGKLTTRAAIAIAVCLVALFFVHLLAAAVSILLLAIMAIWLHLIRPVFWDKAANFQAGARQAGILLGTVAPVILLGLIFASGENRDVPFHLAIIDAWFQFPMHVFATASGFAGGQWYLWPAILALMIVAALGLRRLEWRTAKGGLALAATTLFLAYLVVPDSGLGGNQVKVRFAWMVFLLGGMLIPSVARLQPVRTPIAIFLAACLAFNLVSTSRGVAAYSKAVEDYLSALASIPPGSTLIRLRYPTPDLPDRYGFAGIGRDPLFHLDAYAAARQGFLDLSDYQAPSADFPVIFNPTIDHDKQFALYRLENPAPDESADLNIVRNELPIPIDYALVVADAASPAASLSKAITNLESGMRVIAQSPAPPFVHLYQRIAGR